MFWINSSFCKCRLFSWSIKIYYQQHGICQVHFLLELSTLWHYLRSSVRVNTIISQFHPFHMPRKNAQRNTLMFSTHLLCLLNVDNFRGFYQKVQLLPIPYEAANWNLVILLLTAQDDLVRHIYKAPLSFSPTVRCFISTTILYLWKMQYMKSVI